MTLIIDKGQHQVYVNDQEIFLPKKEFQILELLSKAPGKVFSRTEIFKKIWGNDSSSNERTVDVHLVWMRKKLEGIEIKTIRGVGYKLVTKDVTIRD